MGQLAGGPERAGRLVALVVVVDALVLDGGQGRDNAVVDGGDGGTHLIGGAGGIDLIQRPVEQGGVFRLRELLEIAGEVGQVVGRIGGAGQDGAGLDIQHDHRSALRVLAVSGLVHAVGTEVQDIVLQNLLGGHLQVDVDGGLHVGPGLRLDHVPLRDDIALAVHSGAEDAVGPVQLLLKGQLHALLAHVGVHGVALVLVVVPFLGEDRAGPPQNMGGIGGVVLADGACLDLHTGDVQLGQLGDLAGILDVGEQGVGGQGGIVAQIQLVAQAQNAAHVLVAPVVGDAETAAHELDELGRGDVGIPVVFLEEAAEIAVPGVPGGVGGILKGLGVCDRQVVGIIDVQLPAQVHQAAQGFVGVRGVEQRVVDQDQVVAGPV